MAAPDVKSMFKVRRNSNEGTGGGGRQTQSHLSLFTRKQRFSPKHLKQTPSTPHPTMSIGQVIRTKQHRQDTTPKPKASNHDSLARPRHIATSTKTRVLLARIHQQFWGIQLSVICCNRLYFFYFYWYNRLRENEMHSLSFELILK